MKRIKSGWQLTKKSWAILKDEPGLSKFPIVGGVIALLVAIVLIGPGLYFVDADPIALGVVLIAIGTYLSAFVIYYFAVGLAHNADRRMHGEEVEFRDGMALASSRMSAIAGWAFVATVVMTVIRAVQERFGAAGAIVGGLAGAAWGVLSFLAVPVIAMEGTGPIGTLKRCGNLVKNGWGEQVTGTIAIGGIVFVLGFLPGILLIVGGVFAFASTAAGGGALVAIGAVILIIAALIQQALSTIFGVALYRYVSTKEAVGGFTAEEMQSAVRTKKGHLGSGPGMPSTSSSTI
ncbi:MAG: hypothetical protein IPK93_01355 [Solirubrobacterales bacterium]|nr:hypothetical protein [Solirubrobacterales bacterium]